MGGRWAFSRIMMRTSFWVLLLTVAMMGSAVRSQSGAAVASLNGIWRAETLPPAAPWIAAFRVEK